MSWLAHDTIAMTSVVFTTASGPWYVVDCLWEKATSAGRQIPITPNAQLLKRGTTLWKLPVGMQSR